MRLIANEVKLLKLDQVERFSMIEQQTEIV